MKSKEQTREELKSAVEAFLANGGKVQIGKAKKIPVNRKVTA